jgi:hypothetical protein
VGRRTAVPPLPVLSVEKLTLKTVL